MANPWLVHVKAFRAKHPDMKYKDILVEARKTYTPISKKKGGALKLAGGMKKMK